jgi:hypothetical protein
MRKDGTLKTIDALLMLILGVGDMDSTNIAHKGHQYIPDRLMWLYTPRIIKDATPNIIDALLMLC